MPLDRYVGRSVGVDAQRFHSAYTACSYTVIVPIYYLVVVTHRTMRIEYCVPSVCVR